MRSAFVLLFFVAAAALAACGGGGASGSLPATNAPSSNGTRPSAAMTFHFPAPSTASGARAPKYLSPNTTSVTITITAVNGVPPNPAIPPTTIAVAPGQGTCTAVVSGGFSCTATVGAVAGSDTFLIQAYDSSGTLLSSGSITVAVNPTGTTTVTTPLVLGGVSASTTFVEPSPGPQSDGSALTTAGTWIPPADGTARTLTISVVAKDASGNLIVGPLATPIPIALTDPSGGTLSDTISPSANANGTAIVAVPATVTLKYSGAAYYTAASPAPGTLVLGSGSGATTIDITPLQATPSISLANATVGVPFTVTATEANASTLTFTATAASSGGTFEAACPGATPPPTGATTLSCSTTSGSVAFNVAPTGLGTGGSLAISDANGVSIKQPFDVTPQSGGGINVPPHTVVDYAVFATAPSPAPSPNVNLLLGMTVGPNGSHVYFSEGVLGGIGIFSPSMCIPGATNCIQSATVSGYASPFPLDLVAANGSLIFDDDNTNGVYAAACGGTSCVASQIGAALSAPGPFVNTGSGLVNFEFGGTPELYSPIGALWTSANSPLVSASQAAIGLSGEATATGTSSGGVASLESVVSSGTGPLALPTNFTTLPYCSNPSQTSTDTGTIALDGLALGSDGNLWVVEKDRRYIAAIAPGNCIVGEYPLPNQGVTGPTFPTGVPQKYTVVAGPDGNLWVTDPANNSIDRVTTSGAATAFSIPTPAADPFDIIVGPDGNLWFTEAVTLKIGEVVLQ